MVCAYSTMGCVASPPEVVLRLPEGYVIEAPDRTWAEECGVYLPEVDLQVRQLLGTSNRPARVRLKEEAYEGRLGYANHHSVTVCRTEEWRYVLAHELVHWHAVLHWDCLPTAFEEGLAGLFGLTLAQTNAFVIQPPTPEVLVEALSMGRSRWFRDSGTEHATAAVWLVAQIGMDRLYEHAKEARERGDGYFSPWTFLPEEPWRAIRVRVEFAPAPTD